MRKVNFQWLYKRKQDMYISSILIQVRLDIFHEINSSGAVNSEICAAAASAAL